MEAYGSVTDPQPVVAQVGDGWGVETTEKARFDQNTGQPLTPSAALRHYDGPAAAPPAALRHNDGPAADPPMALRPSDGPTALAAAPPVPPSTRCAPPTATMCNSSLTTRRRRSAGTPASIIPVDARGRTLVGHFDFDDVNDGACARLGRAHLYCNLSQDCPRFSTDDDAFNSAMARPNRPRSVGDPPERVRQAWPRQPQPPRDAPGGGCGRRPAPPAPGRATPRAGRRPGTPPTMPWLPGRGARRGQADLRFRAQLQPRSGGVLVGHRLRLGIDEVGPRVVVGRAWMVGDVDAGARRARRRLAEGRKGILRGSSTSGCSGRIARAACKHSTHFVSFRFRGWVSAARRKRARPQQLCAPPAQTRWH